jgi:hypothetical protein
VCCHCGAEPFRRFDRRSLFLPLVIRRYSGARVPSVLTVRSGFILLNANQSPPPRQPPVRNRPLCLQRIYAHTRSVAALRRFSAPAASRPHRSFVPSCACAPSPPCSRVGAAAANFDRPPPQGLAGVHLGVRKVFTGTTAYHWFTSLLW